LLEFSVAFYRITYSPPRCSQWCGPSPDLRPADPLEVQGLSIDDVEVATSIHKNLGEPSIADDGVDDKWLLLWVQDVVRVVILVDGDGSIGPVQIDRHRCFDREDLLLFLLLLSHGEVHRLPTLDHEAVVDIRGFFTLVASLVIRALVLAI
jgi:hypothetical protein